VEGHSASKPASNIRAEEKIRIVAGRPFGVSTASAELCRREGHCREPVLQLVEGVPGKPASGGLPGIQHEAATSSEVKDLRQESQGVEGSRRRGRAPGNCGLLKKKHDRGWGTAKE